MSSLNEGLDYRSCPVEHGWSIVMAVLGRCTSCHWSFLSLIEKKGNWNKENKNQRPLYLWLLKGYFVFSFLAYMFKLSLNKSHIRGLSRDGSELRMLDVLSGEIILTPSPQMAAFNCPVGSAVLF